jgi:hypothetical protein
MDILMGLAFSQMISNLKYISIRETFSQKRVVKIVCLLKTHVIDGGGEQSNQRTLRMFSLQKNLL